MDRKLVHDARQDVGLLARPEPTIVDVDLDFVVHDVPRILKVLTVSSVQADVKRTISRCQPPCGVGLRAPLYSRGESEGAAARLEQRLCWRDGGFRDHPGDRGGGQSHPDYRVELA